MLFNSFEFLVFLPIVFALYWLLQRERRWQNLLVVIASYIFYGWWDWRFLLLIALTSLCSYGSGVLVEHYEGQRRKQKWVSACNIVLNLTILGVFKYFNFFVDNLEALFGAMGWHIDWVTMNIILPVGISFYTFQALSYTIDVYQKKLPATHDPVEFFAYISFFPQLVAGPIERATNLLPQFQRQRQFDYAKAVDGLRQMLWGLFKKMVIADNCASIVNEHWGEFETMPGLSLLVLLFLFGIQIYGDFSGYSDIAIGCARLFGINLMRNFAFPYFATTIPDFWRRWHISLTTWMRDYIYFPLGGSRCGTVKKLRNVFIVWGVSGLWHGANWTYICWGLYHATLIAGFTLLGLNGKDRADKPRGSWLKRLAKLPLAIVTYLLVVLSWILFRSQNMQQASRFADRLFSTLFDDYHILYGEKWVYCSFAFLLVEWLQRDKQHVLQLPTFKPFGWRWCRWLVYYILIVMIAQNIGNAQTFIYFQF